MPDDMTTPGPFEDELAYEGSGLPKTTNWWGAFVIGLAGTILVTGIAPVMVTSLGAASIPIIFVITFSGYVLCLFLAELSAMMPDRSGAHRRMRIRPTRTAGHGWPSTSTASAPGATGWAGSRWRR